MNNKQAQKIRSRKLKLINKSLKELESMEVNNLKEVNDRDVKKLKTAIINSDFSFPFYIWKGEEAEYIIDGAGRLQALKELQEEGYKLPSSFPAVEIEAKDLNGAKKLVLQASSKHGVITEDSYNLFIEDISMSVTDLESISIDLDKIDLSFDGFGANEADGKEELQQTEIKSANYKSIYQVVVDCENESEQEEVSKYLEEGGYKCRILSL